jgi:hypothetical protein
VVRGKNPKTYIIKRLIILAGVFAMGYVVLARVMGWQILGAPADYFGLLATFSFDYLVARTSYSRGT